MKALPWIFVLLYYGCILGLSAIPAQNLPDTGITFADKPAHMAVYAVLGFLLGRTGWKWPALLGMGLLLGGLDECSQALSPGRQPDPWDWVADGAGVSLGLLFFHFLKRLFSKREG